ncbi:unnamed protein product [Phytophthora lilii]|uniref:Unnamed protein product n=1 Tax=Phytophthora lilii TaxID=2077276 RepID=A0A9W6WQN5_9STRA|nr:unnamed protein product [Phytophthora lilii]
MLEENQDGGFRDGSISSLKDSEDHPKWFDEAGKPSNLLAPPHDSKHKRHRQKQQKPVQDHASEYHEAHQQRRRCQTRVSTRRGGKVLEDDLTRRRSRTTGNSRLSSRAKPIGCAPSRRKESPTYANGIKLVDFAPVGSQVGLNLEELNWRMRRFTTNSVPVEPMEWTDQGRRASGRYHTVDGTQHHDRYRRSAKSSPRPSPPTFSSMMTDYKPSSIRYSKENPCDLSYLASFNVSTQSHLRAMLAFPTLVLLAQKINFSAQAPNVVVREKSEDNVKCSSPGWRDLRGSKPESGVSARICSLSCTSEVESRNPHTEATCWPRQLFGDYNGKTCIAALAAVRSMPRAPCLSIAHTPRSSARASRIFASLWRKATVEKTPARLNTAQSAVIKAGRAHQTPLTLALRPDHCCTKFMCKACAEKRKSPVVQDQQPQSLDSSWPEGVRSANSLQKLQQREDRNSRLHNNQPSDQALKLEHLHEPDSSEQRQKRKQLHENCKRQKSQDKAYEQPRVEGRRRGSSQTSSDGTRSSSNSVLHPFANHRMSRESVIRERRPSSSIDIRTRAATMDPRASVETPIRPRKSSNGKSEPRKSEKKDSRRSRVDQRLSSTADILGMSRSLELPSNYFDMSSASPTFSATSAPENDPLDWKQMETVLPKWSLGRRTRPKRSASDAAALPKSVAVRSTKDNLVKENLVMDDLVKEDLVKEDLVKEDLVKEDLVKDDPVKDNPVKHDPVNGNPATFAIDLGYLRASLTSDTIAGLVALGFASSISTVFTIEIAVTDGRLTGVEPRLHSSLSSASVAASFNHCAFRQQQSDADGYPFLTPPADTKNHGQLQGRRGSCEEARDLSLLQNSELSLTQYILMRLCTNDVCFFIAQQVCEECNATASNRDSMKLSELAVPVRHQHACQSCARLHPQATELQSPARERRSSRLPRLNSAPVSGGHRIDSLSNMSRDRSCWARDSKPSTGFLSAADQPDQQTLSSAARMSRESPQGAHRSAEMDLSSVDLRRRRHTSAIAPTSRSCDFTRPARGLTARQLLRANATELQTSRRKANATELHTSRRIERGDPTSYSCDFTRTTPRMAIRDATSTESKGLELSMLDMQDVPKSTSCDLTGAKPILDMSNEPNELELSTVDLRLPKYKVGIPAPTKRGRRSSAADPVNSALTPISIEHLAAIDAKLSSVELTLKHYDTPSKNTKKKPEKLKAKSPSSISSGGSGDSSKANKHHAKPINFHLSTVDLRPRPRRHTTTDAQGQKAKSPRVEHQESAVEEVEIENRGGFARFHRKKSAESIDFHLSTFDLKPRRHTTDSKPESIQVNARSHKSRSKKEKENKVEVKPIPSAPEVTTPTYSKQEPCDLAYLENFRSYTL